MKSHIYIPDELFDEPNNQNQVLKWTDWNAADLIPSTGEKGTYYSNLKENKQAAIKLIETRLATGNSIYISNQ